MTQNPARQPSSASGKADVAHAVLFSSAAALGGFLFGYDTSVINGAVKAIQERFTVGTAATGLTVSLALLGAAAGAWFAGGLADRFGRIRVMQIAAVLFVVSAVGSALPFLHRRPGVLAGDRRSGRRGRLGHLPRLHR